MRLPGQRNATSRHDKDRRLLGKLTWDREQSPRKTCRDGSLRNEIELEREIGPGTEIGTVTPGRENAERGRLRERETDEKERKNERGNEPEIGSEKPKGRESTRERETVNARCGGRGTSFWIRTGDGTQEWEQHNLTNGEPA